MKMMPTYIDPPVLPAGIHLNIGCGKRLWPGFVNIDFPSNWSGKKPDIECDVRKLELPDDYADSAWSIHVIEHIFRWETLDTLKEWRRVLKPGARLVLEMPCLDRVIGFFIDAKENGGEIAEQTTMWRLYGDPAYKDQDMVHKWCFSVNEMVGLMGDAGFMDVEYGSAIYHHPLADMRVTGIK